MLSDKIGTVRLESLKALSMLYSEASIQVGLASFTERFKARISDMALHEKESNIRYEACKVVNLIAQLGFFEDEEIKNFLPLIMDDDQKVRDALSPLFVSVFKEQYEDKIMEELKEISENEDDTVRFASLKSLCTILVETTKITEEYTKKTEKDLESLKNDVASFETLEISDIYSEDAENNRKKMSQELNDISSWITNESAFNSSIISPIQIEVAVTCIYKQLPFLAVFNFNYRIPNPYVLT